jgi:nitrite reductase/ring-hydroxylating ferredoxin subunit
LRQYLRRALREGCTPVEVLDALLMAFPALGLAKIIWAVDVILDMKLPEFQDLAMEGHSPNAVEVAIALPARWHDVMASTAVPDGEVQRTECDGMGLFIYREKKKISVFDSRCPHQSTNIELALQGTTMTCPKHQWQFDAKSGDCIKTVTARSNIESKVVKAA